MAMLRAQQWHGRQLREMHVLITGASSGLGAAMARHLAKGRGTITLVGRNDQRLNEVAQDCRGIGAIPRILNCDVADASDCDSKIRRADEDQPIDILIANAGIGGVDVLAPPSGEPVAFARKIIDVNLMGVVHTIAPVLETFMQRQRGHIAIVSSMMAFQGLADAPIYAASKAAVRTYGQGLRRLLAPQGVSVTVACPGFVATPMSASLPFTGPFMLQPDDAAQRIINAMHRRRAEIAFPWQLALLAKSADLLPTTVVDRLLSAGRSFATSPPR